MSLLSSPVCMDPMDPRVPPSISQLFRTNAAPAPADAQRIHRLLEERKAKLATFSIEIERVRAQVLRLEQQRDQIKVVVQELEALLSPVRRMPTDIMASVFEHCILDYASPKADPRTAPLLLGHVCRSWRRLLLSLPCLWTTLHLDLPPGTKDWSALVQSKSHAMHMWLSHSKSLPVSLFVNHAKGSPIPWDALMLLDKEILTLSPRLKDLSLHFSPRSLSCLLTFAQCPLPCLQHLELQNTNPLPTNENPPPIVLHSAPNLKNLSLSWCSLDLRDFEVPWAQLLHLNLEYQASSFWNPVHSDYLPTLAHCPNLTTLYLGIGALIAGADPSRIESVTLPHVQTFKVNVYTQTPYLSHFFDAIHMPQLRHFDIRNVSLTLGSFTGQTEFLPFLMRCADTLESVCLDRVDIPDSVVLSCLERLHRLKTMSFLPSILRLNHGLITALTYNGANSRVCPALEVLQLRCSSAIPPDAIACLVASRRQTEPMLKWFSLQLATFEYGLDVRDDKIEQVRTRLKGYVEGGLQLILTKSNSSG